MLGLLLKPDPKRVALLGLGGVSLARALRAARHGIRILGVERRAAVIDIARMYFDLPDGRHFTAVCAEAFDEQMLHLHVEGGNIVAFAFRESLPGLRREGFFEAAQSLGLRLGIPLQRHARNPWRQNAETLG